MKSGISILFLFSLVFLLACSDGENTKKIFGTEGNKTSKNKMIVERNIDPIQYSKGQKLFLTNCASCHGKYGEGAEDWRKPDEKGNNPPPPLNGTGHSWHHSTNSLTNTIKNGTAKIGGNMPAWGDKLSDSEIRLILVWIKSQWPDELYTAWYNRFHQK